MGIRELLERLTLDCFNNPFKTDTGSPAKNIHTFDKVDERKTVFTCCALHFTSSASPSTEVRIIYGVNLNSASFLAYILETSTIGYHHNAEKEGAK